MPDAEESMILSVSQFIVLAYTHSLRVNHLNQLAFILNLRQKVLPVLRDGEGVAQSIVKLLSVLADYQTNDIIIHRLQSLTFQVYEGDQSSDKSGSVCLEA